MLATIKLGSKPPHVIRNGNLLRSIGWVMDASRKVKKETIVNCFSKCRYNEGALELFIDDDTDAGFAGLKIYISEVSPDSKVESYLNQDKDAAISVNTIDILSIK